MTAVHCPICGGQHEADTGLMPGVTVIPCPSVPPNRPVFIDTKSFAALAYDNRTAFDRATEVDEASHAARIQSIRDGSFGRSLRGAVEGASGVDGAASEEALGEPLSSIAIARHAARTGEVHGGIEETILVHGNDAVVLAIVSPREAMQRWDASVRVLLSVEWERTGLREEGKIRYHWQQCPECADPPERGAKAHKSRCALDSALIGAGLITQADRDAARIRMAEEKS